MKYTPGPWKSLPLNAKGNEGKHVVTSGADYICICDAIEGREKNESNARLIAAAPAMNDAGHKLVMLALQSDRYTSDPDYRDAVDNWLTVEKLAKGGN